MAGKQGRVALVTGAAASIGQAYAQRLAADGAKVVVVDIADGAETVELCRAAGSDAISVVCDVSSAEQVSAAKDAAVEAFGTVDILVHNAAIFDVRAFVDMTFEHWRRVMSVNLDSAFHVLHELIPGMLEQQYGRIVCISSNTFHAGVAGQPHYVAAKGGIIGLVRALAREFGDQGITINSVAPGFTRSQGTTRIAADLGVDIFAPIAQLQSIKRTETPEDLVGAISFLTSDDANFITGQTLLVDGGWTHA